MCDFKNVFIDANIFIDLNDESRGNLKSSLSILDYLVAKKISIFTSCDLITTIYYILSKKDKELALKSIEQLNTICKVIEFSNKQITETCLLMRSNKNYSDLEDTIQYVLAKNTSCDVIISNDKNFYSENVLLINSTEFIKKFIQKA